MKTETVIVVAEDDAGHFALVKKNLWRSAVQNEILHFNNGQDVLDFFFADDNAPRMAPDTPYILLLDIRMPKVDGVEVLRRIKSDESLSKMPVIMLTTTDDPAEVARCHDLGCSFYIPKPSDYNSFMECVEHLGDFLSMEGLKVPLLQPPVESRKSGG
ncbi:MAG: response regulator [Sedimentisphaerales bacterium]|nr:response regulator [Sedimentisphaerales bacterium]